MPPPSIEQVIARIPEWAGKTISMSFLSGGITNLNYRVKVGGDVFVVRIGGENTDLLLIDRENEHAANLNAARAGLAPEVIHFLRPEGYLVTRFVVGDKIPPEEMSKRENIVRLTGALKRVHALPAIPGTFSPFRVTEKYRETAARFNVTPPVELDWFFERGREIEAAVLRRPFEPKPCHNDLLNENFIVQGDHLWILDWEYAGMGDVYFDLGNVAVHHGFTDEQDALLLETYFGGSPTPAMIARQKLMKVMSDFREAMWGVAQMGISKLDFDFKGYAEKHFNRLRQNSADSRYAEWLKNVASG